MPLGPRKLPLAIWARLPESLRRRAGSTGGRRLMRFAPAAALALATTQITYFICFSVLAMTARASGAAGWLAGAAVSYGGSGLAWERKGKPRVLKGRLPFLAVALAVAVVLTEPGHLGYRWPAGLRL